MLKQSEHLRALYEIAVSIGGTLDLDILAQAAVSEYHSKLKCVASSLVENSHSGFSIYTSFGISAKLHTPLLNFLAEMPQSGSSQLLRHISTDELHHAIFELPGFGALILSTEQEINLAMQQDLVKLNQNFASACIACLRSKSLQQSQQETQKALQVKKEFLSNISHELRTPMNAVLGFSNLLLRNKKQERTEEFARQIVKAANNLMKLINDMLDFNAIESNNTKLVNLSCQLQEEILVILKPLAKYAELKGISFSSSVVDHKNPEIWTDGKRLSQVISRIADNAVKFCEAGDSIKIICEILPYNKKQSLPKETQPTNNCVLQFTISDTGPGIPKNLVSTIFDPFHQANNSVQRKQQGAGLGLAICQRNIHKVGGDIHVLDRHPGCHIQFTWPCKLYMNKQPEKPHNLEQCKFLVVDDNEVNRQVLIALLEKFGSQVDVAENGLIAVNICQKQVFQMIFMDYHMPIMNGIDATKIIRKLSSVYERIPIIAVTADITPQTRKKCLDAGMNGILNKPLNGDTVEALALNCIMPNQVSEIPKKD